MKTNNILNPKHSGFRKTVTIIVLVAVAVAAGLGGWLIWRTFFSKAAKELPKAVMTLDPATGNFNVGQEFNVNIILDTKGAEVPDAAGYLKFNPKELEVVKVVPNTRDIEGNEKGIFERSWYPKDEETLAAANRNGWIVIAGMTETNEQSGQSGKAAVGTGTEGEAGDTAGEEKPDFFKGVDKLGTVTFSGKQNATTEVRFIDAPSAVMFPQHDAYSNIGQPNKEAENILEVTKGGTYVIGEGGEEPLPAPINLTAKGGNKKVQLAWEYALDNDKIQYRIYRATIEKTGISIGDESGSVTSAYKPLKEVKEKTYLDEAVVNGTTYSYYVTAFLAEEESAPSNKANATPRGEGGEVLHADIAHNEDGNAVYGRDGRVDAYDFIFLMSVWTWKTEQIKEKGYTDPNVDYAKYVSGSESLSGENVGSGDVTPGSDGVVSAPEFIWMMNEWLEEI
jgi:hypothetical protein